MTKRATSSADNRAIKIKEADTCHAMGLLNEALSIYEGLFSDIDEQDVETKRGIGAIFY